MRQIGTVTSATDLHKLTDFLLTQGIKTHVDTEPTGHLIWAYDEDRIAQAREIVAEFLKNPTDPRYAKAGQEARRLRELQSAREQELRRRIVPVSRLWGRGGTRPIATWLLIVLSIAATYATKMGQPLADVVPQRQAAQAIADPPSLLIQRLTIVRFVINAQTNQFRYFPLFNPRSSVARGEVWRLVTPIFLHFAVLHIGFNMLSLHSLGSLLERRYGWRFLLLFVLFSAVVSDVAQYLLDGPGFGGMSGVVYALFGFAWMRGEHDRSAGFRLPPKSVFIMLLWLFLCLTGVVGSIANGAHFAGLMVGATLGYAPWRHLRGRRGRR